MNQLNQLSGLFLSPSACGVVDSVYMMLTSCHRRARDTVAEREVLSEFSEEAIKKREQEVEERKKQSYEMVADSIKRELAESTFGALTFAYNVAHSVTQRKPSRNLLKSTTRMASTLKASSKPGVFASLPA